MIFRTFENNNIDKWTAKIGILGKSFNELGTAISNAFGEYATNFDENGESFFELLKNKLFPTDENGESWIKNTLGEIISVDNIDSYIEELDLDSASQKLQEILDFNVNKTANQSWQDYFGTINDGNRYLLDLIQNTDDLTTLTGEDLVRANQNARQSVIDHNRQLQQQTLSYKAGQAAIQLFNTALNIGVSLLISQAITLISDLVTHMDRLADKAEEVGSAFETSKTEIADYKTKIQELNDTINDSSTPYEDVVQARKDLMSIQDEMIEKYDEEGNSIKLITDAIKGMSSAFDDLTYNQYQKMLNDFNKTDSWTDAVNNWFMGSTNLEQMLQQESSYGTRIKVSGNKDLDEYIEKLGATELFEENGRSTGYYTLKGTLNDVYEKLLSIQTVANELGETDYENNISSQVSKAQELVDKYDDMYNAYVLYNDVLDNTDYKSAYEEASSKYKDYQKAVEENGLDSDEAQKAAEEYASVISDVTKKAFENGDTGVINFFESMYPDLQTIVNQWKFEAKITPKWDDGSDNEDYDADTDSNMKSALSKFSNAEEILNFDSDTASKDQKTAMTTLRAIAEENFDNDLDALVDAAIKFYDLETQGQQDFVNKINGRSLSGDDTKPDDSRYDKDSADDFYNSLTSDEDKALVTSDEFVKALDKQSTSLKNGKWSAEDYADALQSVKDAQNTTLDEPLTFNSYISSIQKLSDGFDQLDSIYADVYNKEDFDWSSILNNDSFIEAFGNMQNVTDEYKDAYDNFIETVSNSPSDINKCQSAFNDLATAYLYNSGVLDDLTEETKQATINQMEQMGIANAEEIANAALANSYSELAFQKWQAENASYDFANATVDDINSINLEGAYADTTRQKIALYTLQKQLSNQTTIYTGDDIENLKALALSAGAGSAAIATMGEALEAMEHNKDNRFFTNDPSRITRRYNAIYAQLAASIEKTTSVQVQYVGGVKSASAAQSAAKDATEDATDALEKQKEALEDAKEEWESLADAIAWFYDNQTDKIDDQIDKLNDANDALNDQKDTYDNILDAIDKVYEKQIDAIQERIDALDEANDEEEKSLELEKARQALEEARRKKNIKVYTKNSGFVYTVDESAIKDAEDEYNDLVDEMQKDEIKKALEDQIEALNKLRDTFADIPNAWQDAMNKMKASEMFGNNWEIDILNPSDDLINNFRNQYTGTQDQIQSNENKIDSLEAEKERIEELKQLWEDAKNAYKYSQYEAKLSSFFGSDYEYQLLNNSAAWRGKFVEEYSNVCSQIEALEQQIKDLENESADSASSAADSTSDALGKTSNAIRDASNTAKDNSIGKYLWGQEDDEVLGIAMRRLSDLNTEIAKGTGEDLGKAKDAVHDFFLEWANFKNTGEVTDALVQSINDLQTADGEYFASYGNALDGVKNRLSESAQYTNNAAQCIQDASGNIEVLNQQLATLNTSTSNVETTVDQAVSDAGITIDDSVEKITALKDAMGELVAAKAELQSAVDESVTDVSDVIATSGDKVSAIQDQITVLLDNIDLLNDALANLADKMSALDDVTLDSVCNALGAADGSTGLIGSINTVITAISGQNGLIMQLQAVDDASLGEITLGFGSEDGVGLLGAVQNVSNAIYMEDSEECLIGKINKIAETIETIDSASNAFLIMQANILLAEAEVQKLIDLINSIPEEKHTYHYIHTIHVGEATGTAFTGYASGTATPSGKSYAKGTGDWGLPQDQKKAAVAEIGRELLLRDGQYFIIDKPQLMDLKKGDIIFNNAQTESILKNGKNSRIKEFARLAEPVAEKLHKQGYSFATGTAKWKPVDIFEELRNSGAVFDEKKFNTTVAKINTDPDAIKNIFSNPTSVPDWSNLANGVQAVNTTNNQQTNVTYQFTGDLSFPNITTGNDAKKLINELQHISASFLQKANKH